MRVGRIKIVSMSTENELIEVRKLVCIRCGCVCKIYILKKDEKANRYNCNNCEWAVWIRWDTGEIFDAITKKKVDEGCFFLLEPYEY